LWDKGAIVDYGMGEGAIVGLWGEWRSLFDGVSGDHCLMG